MVLCKQSKTQADQNFVHAERAKSKKSGQRERAKERTKQARNEKWAIVSEKRLT